MRPTSSHDSTISLPTRLILAAAVAATAALAAAGAARATTHDTAAGAVCLPNGQYHVGNSPNGWIWGEPAGDAKAACKTALPSRS